MSAALTFLDWCLILIFIISLLLGVFKGLVRELFSLGFLILGAVLAYRLSAPVGSLLHRWVRGDIVARFLAFVSILLMVVILGIWVTWLVKKIFLHGALSLVDRVLGGILGAIRGLLFDCVILVAVIRLPAGPGWVDRSVVAPALFAGMRAVVLVLPESVGKRIEGYLYHAKQENRRNRGTV